VTFKDYGIVLPALEAWMHLWTISGCPTLAIVPMSWKN